MGTYDAVSITLPPLRTGILPKSKNDIFLGQQSSSKIELKFKEKKKEYNVDELATNKNCVAQLND